MISAKQYFELAQLAEASYASLVDGNAALADQLQNADDNMSFSASQATELAAHWSVSAHRPNTASGFSSTLFKSLDAGGGYVFAIRGTEGVDYDDLLVADITDIATDGIALDQVVDLYNEWKRITAPAGQSYQVAKLVDLVSGGSPSTVLLDMPSGLYKTIEFADSTTIYPAGSPYATGLGLNIAPGNLTVTGHSLGGHLADAFTRLFPAMNAAALTVNGAGFATGSLPGLGGTAQINIANLFGMLGGTTGFNSADILNLYGDKNPEIVTMNGPGLFQQGGHEAIFIEQDSFFGNVAGHGASQMTDSLALYSLFATLDPALNTANPADGIAKITAILKSASAQNGNTLETTLDALRTLFQQNYQYGQLEYDAVPTLDSGTAASRDDYYTNLQSLQAWLKDNPLPGLGITPLAGTSATQIATLALADTAEGQAYRYALFKLNPFVVTGSSALYDGINAHNELKLYTPTSNTGRFTEQYLKDRAAMLSWKLHFGTHDTEPVGDTFVKPQSGTPFYFEDFTSNAITTKMRIGGGDSVNAVMSRPLGDFRLIVFGSENNDVLTGQGKGDRLCGDAYAYAYAYVSSICETWKEAA